MLVGTVSIPGRCGMLGVPNRGWVWAGSNKVKINLDHVRYIEIEERSARGFVVVFLMSPYGTQAERITVRTFTTAQEANEWADKITGGPCVK